MQRPVGVEIVLGWENPLFKAVAIDSPIICAVPTIFADSRSPINKFTPKNRQLCGTSPRNCRCGTTARSGRSRGGTLIDGKGNAMHQPAIQWTRFGRRGLRSVFFVLCTLASALACTASDSLPQSASIAGRVFGIDGRPVGGVDVALYKPQTPAEPDSVSRRKTDENGQFRFEAVPASFYKLLVLPKGFGIVGRRLTIEAGQRVSSLVFHLSPAETAALRVVDAGGKPLAGVAIRRFTLRGEAGELTLDGIELRGSDCLCDRAKKTAVCCFRRCRPARGSTWSSVVRSRARGDQRSVDFRD